MANFSDPLKSGIHSLVSLVTQPVSPNYYKDGNVGLESSDRAEASLDSREGQQAREAMALTHTRATVFVLSADAHVDQPFLTVGGRGASFAT